MPPLAQRNLFHDKIRLTVTLTGIVFAVVLIVVELGLFVGFTQTTSSLIDHSGADLWVTAFGVVIGGFADVVQQACAAGKYRIHSELFRHHAGDERHFD